MTTPSANQIYTFKMTTGEEIVAKIVSISDDHLIVSHPILCALSPNGLQMMPGLFSAKMEQDVRLNTNNIVMIAETREDVRTNWYQATTGIVPISRSIITG
jgi:hypothetical protein